MSVDSRSDSSGGSAGDLAERYGLSSDPFADTPARFFCGGQRQHYLDSLHHLCSFGDMALVVVGEPGVGRSRLLAEFRRRDQAYFDFKSVTTKECMSLERLGMALEGLAPGAFTPSDSSRSVNSFFGSPAWERSSARRGVLLIEDAEKIPFEVLAELVRGFASGSRTRAPVPLFIGSERLVVGLQNALEEQSQCVHPLRVSPLSQEETIDYVEQCFRWAGGSLSGGLKGSRGERLQREAGGNFRLIKKVAPEVLLGSGGESKAAVPQKRRRQTLALVLALSVLSLSYLVVSWQYRADRPASHPSELALEPERPDEVARLREAMTLAEQRMLPTGQPAERVETPGAGMPAHGSGLPPLGIRRSMLSWLPASISLPPHQAAALALEERVIPSLPRPNDEKPDMAEQSDKSSEADLSVLKGTSAGSAAAPDTFEPMAIELFRDRAWVEAIQPDTFTVQILGSYDEQAAVRFIRDHSEVKLVYVRSSYQGRPWYVVLHGSYDDLAGAKAAVAELPVELRSSAPWVRRATGL